MSRYLTPREKPRCEADTASPCECQRATESSVTLAGVMPTTTLHGKQAVPPLECQLGPGTSSTASNRSVRCE